jgi:hypothetical protein
MEIQVDALVAALKKTKFNADNLSDQEKAQVATAVAELTAPLNTRLTAAETLLQAINDAVVDPELTPEETVVDIAKEMTNSPAVPGEVTPAFPA